MEFKVTVQDPAEELKFPSREVWHHHTCRVFLEGEQVAFMRACSLSEERFQEVCPDVWHYMHWFHGWCFPLDTLADIWAGAHRYSHISPPGFEDDPRNILAEHCPEKEKAQEDLDNLLLNLDSTDRSPSKDMEAFRRRAQDAVITTVWVASGMGGVDFESPRGRYQAKPSLQVARTSCRR